MMQWLALSPNNKKAPDSNLPASANWTFSVRRLHVPPVPVWVSSGCYGFFPQAKDTQMR